MLDTLLDFGDLKARNIVRNRMTLGRRIKHDGFPPGFLIGPNSRRWYESEVQAWLDRKRGSPPSGDVAQSAA